ncbi:MAG: T9SS type A sorting domain-containing protein [Candidatus Kapaibacteriales bacterium]
MKFQNFLFLSIFAIFLSSQLGFTPIEITVGKTPTFIYGYYDINVHDFKLLVITAGVDANFNLIKDPEDENPAIYTVSYESIYSGNLSGNKLTELPFVWLPFPVRPAIAPSRNSIFIPIGRNINEYNISDGSLINSFVPFDTNALGFESFKPSAVFYDKDLNYVFVSLRTTEGNDKVHVIDLSDFSIVDTLSVPENPQQLLTFEDNLYVLCEGTFGAGDSKIYKTPLSTLGTGNRSFTVVTLGNGANHLTTVSDPTKPEEKYVVVTMNGDGQIHALDPSTLSVKKTLQLPVSGWDGPRETHFFGGEIPFITAYNGNLYYYRNADTLALDSIVIGNKLESIFGYKSPNPMINFEILAVSSPFKIDYSSNDKIYILLNFTSVEKQISTNQFEITLYPNPTSDFVVLKVGEQILTPIELELVDLLGKTVSRYHFNLIGQEVILPISNLNPGTYFAQINGNNKAKTIPFTIIR